MTRNNNNLKHNNDNTTNLLNPHQPSTQSSHIKMPTLHLRTYTLSSPSLARAYAQRWTPTSRSIAKLNVTTRGVYLSETNPKQVLAMIEFKDGSDPEKIIEEYAGSEDFKKDLGEVGLGDIEGVESQELREVGLGGK